MKMFRSNSGFFFFMFLLSFPSSSLADPRTSIAEIICGNSSYSDKNFFTENYIKNMEGLFQLARDHQWGTVIVNSSSMPPIYGLLQCFSDLSPTECLLCYAECHMKISRCLPSYSSRIFLDGCFIRYDNYNFFEEFIDDKVDRTTCDPTVLVQENLKPEFKRNAAELMINLSSIALKNGGFEVGMSGNGESSVYGLVQCWKNISIKGCSLCLQKGWRDMKSCLPGREGKALLAGCYLRYSDYEFYNGLYPENHQGFPRTGIIIVLSTSIFTASLLCFLAVFLFTRRLKRKKEKKKLGKAIRIQKKSHLNFKYEVLEKATNFFEKSKKLGQGGAGTVYKGTLPDGRTVAVKRLFYSTTQWVDEFFNEVNLVSGFQHKNLVKLLGCSIEGPESLLVYEYMPNKSLDQYFTHGEMNGLNWKQRYNIIVGVAEGLAYLHCGSEKRIIHRDIKRSNILLDENLNAKIADFGLARCFANDKSHLSTGIAGTVGYMAPEYLVRGQLTEKVDIYAFGVLVLEVVCGRTNNAHLQDSGSVLHMVWRNYKSDALEESIDNSLRSNFLEKEAVNVIQIGLLCAQASASLRPSMEEVVQMLTDRDFVIPMPMQPPFLSSSKIFSDISVYSTSS